MAGRETPATTAARRAGVSFVLHEYAHDPAAASYALEAVDALGLDPARVIVTVDQHANTSAASVPLALDTAVKDGRIKPGDLIVLEAMGGGFTWGAAALRY